MLTDTLENLVFFSLNSIKPFNICMSSSQKPRVTLELKLIFLLCAHFNLLVNFVYNNFFLIK